MLKKFCQEFNGGLKCKFVRNKAEEGFEEVISRFEVELDTLDHVERFERDVNKLCLKGTKWKKKVIYQSREVGTDEKLKMMLRIWWWNFMRTIDRKIIKKLGEEVNTTSQKRIAIKETVFNFTGKQIPDEMMSGLKHGSNYVMHTKMRESEARKKFEEEMWTYLIGYRKFIQRGACIVASNIHEWINKVIEESEKENEHYQFYYSVRNSISVELGLGKMAKDGMKINCTELDELRICIIEADKGVGLCLMNVDDVYEADRKLVKELGGQSCEGKNAEDIKSEIGEKIEVFEESLDLESKKYMNVYYSERFEDCEGSEIPFLKVKPKIHKLSQEQLEKRSIEKLKFRPVVDSSRGPTNSYARSLMDYLRGLITRTESTLFNQNGTMIKNGHEVTRIMKSLGETNKSSNFFAVADLSSAYTFVYLNNLLVAMRFLGERLMIPSWKRKLFEQMAKLVFENSYLESSAGVFHLNTSLPMGLCTSGECLDIVLLVAELVFLGKVSGEEVPGFLDQYDEYKKPKDNVIEETFISYKRYRDDTFTIVKHSKESSVRNAVEVLGHSFLPSLDINIEMTKFVGIFLDVVFFKRFSNNGYEMMLKRKGPYPISYAHGNSNMSSSIIRSIIGGEVLRHRRLTSNRKLQEVNDECLIKELVSREYNESFIRKAVQKRIEIIGQEYTSEFVRRVPRSNVTGLVYGSKTVFDGQWQTHSKLYEILRQSLPEGVR